MTPCCWHINEWDLLTARPSHCTSKKDPRWPLSRRLGGLQSRCGRFWGRGDFLPLAGFETRTVQSLYRRRNKLIYVKVQRRRCHGMFWIINIHMVVACVSVQQLSSKRWQQPTNQHGAVNPGKGNHSFQRRVMLYHVCFGEQKKMQISRLRNIRVQSVLALRRFAVWNFARTNFDKTGDVRTYVWSNTEARSPNYCWLGKALHILSVCFLILS